jgi:oligoendopeptidase F
MASAISLPKRSEIPEEHTWNLAGIFPTADDWRSAMDKVQEGLPALTAYKGKLGESADTLASWFKDYQERFITASHVYVYSTMQSDTDTGNQEWLAMRDQARGMFARFGAATAFAEPELLEIPQEQIEEFMRENSDRELYRHYFDVLRRREGHVRSGEVESLLAMAGDPLDLFRATHAILADAEIDYGTVQTEQGEVQVAAGTMEALLHSTDIEVRKAAWSQYADGYLKFKNTFAILISNICLAIYFVLIVTFIHRYIWYIRFEFTEVFPFFVPHKNGAFTRHIFVCLKPVDFFWFFQIFC